MDKAKLIPALTLFALGSFLLLADGVQTGAKNPEVYDLETMVKKQNQLLSSKKFNQNKNDYMPGSGEVFEELKKSSQFE